MPQLSEETSTQLQRGLTFAGIGVASLSRPPGQVMVEVPTLLTVQALRVVVTHAVPVNLQTVSEYWRNLRQRLSNAAPG